MVLSDDSQEDRMDLEQRDLDDIKPYWRNPRHVTEESVAQLAESIREYGYQQPVVVDGAGVIIVGHTRYAALRSLGVKRAPVKVARDLTPEQVRQYRLMDNRTGEFSSWDFESLVAELAELDGGLTDRFFPEVRPGGFETGGQEQIASQEPEPDPEVAFVCPSCFHSWEMKVARQDVLAGVLEVKQ